MYQQRKTSAGSAQKSVFIYLDHKGYFKDTSNENEWLLLKKIKNMTGKHVLF